jgi:gas vesicle protein
MKRLLIGLAVGVGALGLAVRYFVDPVNGKARRQNALHLWHQSNKDVLEGGGAVFGQVKEASHESSTAVSEAASAMVERVEQASADDEARLGAQLKSAAKAPAKG